MKLLYKFLLCFTLYIVY